MSRLRVVVLLRRAPATPDGSDAGALLGSCDEAALRAAVALEDADVTALAAGPAEREDAVLRLALDAGVAHATRVDDPSLEGIDYHGVARVLSAALRLVDHDLILAGDRSVGEGQGAVGPAVAELLAMTHITAAVDVRRDHDSVLVERRDVALRRLRLPLPALVTVVSSAAPRPSLRPAAERAAEVQALDLQALGLQAPELRHRAAALGRTTAVRSAVTLFTHPEELVARLREERLL